MFEEFPKFEFNEFILREIDPLYDAQKFLEYISNRNVSKFIGDDSVPKTLESAILELRYWASLFKMQRSYYWAIADKFTNNIIGTIGYNSINKQHKRGELSYDLSQKFWGRGIMTRSIEKIIDFSFNDLGLVRIQATVGMHNERSIKILEKLNFKREGELAKYECLEDKFFDFYMYAVTRDI